MTSPLRALACAILVLLATAATETARACSADEIGTVIDGVGSRLRQLNMESQPRLRAKLRELAMREGWPDTEIDTRSEAFLKDDELRALDDQAGELLVKLDRLGDDNRPGEEACQRLQEAKVTADQLIEVTRLRTSHAYARIEASLAPRSRQVDAAPSPADAARPDAGLPEQRTARVSPPAPPPAPPRARPSPAWDTQTSREEPPADEVMAQLPRPIAPEDLRFSEEEIRAAGRGFFGSISAGLASILEYAFRRYGQPTGYVMGTEGGGALFAGLRYGEGTLVSKSFGERRIYWQGPSVGYDFGAAGSRVLFLVYNLERESDMHARFAGVDGSAYLVGGAGITFLKKGPVVLAPIRTGLGLRLGASVGYLKFTREATLNPF